MDIENIKYLLSRRVGGDNSLEEDCLLVINELQKRLRTAEDLAEARRRGAENIINELAAAECDGQDHVIEFVTNAAGFLDAKFNSYQPKAGDKLYTHPPKAATHDGPTDIQVYRWFQESTIAHHIEEDGEHISKRAMFIAKKAWAAALQSDPPQAAIPVDPARVINTTVKYDAGFSIGEEAARAYTKEFAERLKNWRHVGTIPTGIPNHGYAHFYEPIIEKYPKGDSDE